MQNVAVLVGSLRRDSINLRFAKALEKLAESKLKFTYLDIGSLPHYNDDLWANPPESVLTLKRQIAAADGVLFVTPEYMRDIPGVLTNAIYWAARPYGKSAWNGKPGAIVGTSPGVIGTAAAQVHLRSLLSTINVTLMGEPQVYFQTKPGLIDDSFTVTDEGSRAFLQGWVDKFSAWIDRHGEERQQAAAE
ncbi:MAG TPA: NAD(P)H-dependent oxidoreductase [Devosiaceae bacterium]|jgi:chromate reductase